MSNERAQPNLQTSTGYGPSSRRIHLHFDGRQEKFESFEVKFKSYLRLRKLTKYTWDASGDDTTDEVRNQIQEQNAEVFAELVQVLDDNSLALIMRDAEDDGRKAMKILRDHYLPKGKPRIIGLYTELSSMSKKEHESVTEYVIRAETAAAQLRSAGETITDGLLVAMTLKGLPKEFHSFVTVITQDENDVTFCEFKARLRNYEDTVNQQRSAPSSTPSSAVMNVKNANNKKFAGSCFKCGKQGHRANDCYSKTGQQKWCSFCKNTTHSTDECRKRKVHSVKSVQQSGDDGEEHTFAFLASGDDTGMSDLLVDCGATSHILCEESTFVTFDGDFDPATHIIEMADGRREKGLAKKRGTARVKLRDADGHVRECNLYDALYVPSFKQNIFSVQAATKRGASINFSESSASLVSGKTRFKIYKKGQLYFLPMSSSVSASVKVCRTLKEWHIILGHCNRNDILKMEQNCAGMQISDKSDFDCEVCTLGKMTDVHSRLPDKSAKENLDLVHTDLAGPIDPPDINGMIYSMLCTDAYSRYVIPYFLKQKSDAHKAFSQYLADVAPYGQVKSVRSDVGGEFIAENFKSILVANKIQQQKTAPYSAHQNGKAERTWRSLFEMARCLLLQSGLPKTLWTYAVMAAAYIRNRCYHQNIGCTPFEKMTGKKPNIANMEAFGSTCYALVQNPKKLEDRCAKGIFVGFDKGSPAHLVYFPETETVRKFRCVKFPKQSQIGQEDDHYVELPFENNVTITNENDHNENNEKSVPQCQGSPTTESERDPKQSTTGRIRNKPKYLDDYVLDKETDHAINESQMYAFTIDHCYNANVFDVPQSYSEAISSSDASKWDLAMKNEMQALEENDTFEVVPLPEGKQVIGSKWVYAIKTDKHGEEHFKARFVAKGYSQTEGIDYQETFSPTARMNSIRMISQIAIENDLEIHQMDVKAAYLNAPIDCDVYVKQPEGYVKGEQNGLVLKLKKSLYGLKQSGRNWNNTLDTFLKEEGFQRSLNDPCFYTRSDNVYLVHWVDDIIIAAKSCILKSVKTSLKKRFEMKDLGEVSYFLGIEFETETNRLSMCQSRYISKILTRFRMDDCKPRSTPCEMNPTHKITEYDNVPLNEQHLKRYRQIVGSLIYVMTATRPDIAYIVTKLSQYMSCATQYHMTMAKQTLRYLKGTINDKLIFRKSDKPFEIIGFSDSDWAGSIEDRKSITGYSFKITEDGPFISWRAQKQQTVALSSCEAEYMALCSAVQEGKYLMSFLNEILDQNQTQFSLFCDNQGANALAKNPVNHKRSKHIDIKYHFVRDEVSREKLCLLYVPSCENVADIFTKPVSMDKLRKFKPLLMGI